MTKSLTDMSRGLAGLYAKGVKDKFDETIKIDFSRGMVVK